MNDDQILECVKCGKWTSALEARLRRFNEGKCGYCNGRLEPLPEPRPAGNDVTNVDPKP